MLNITVLYCTSPVIEDWHKLCEMTNMGVVPGLHAVADHLNKPGVIDEMPDDWSELQVTMSRER